MICDLCGEEIENGQEKSLAMDTDNTLTIHFECFEEINKAIEELKELSKEPSEEEI